MPEKVPGPFYRRVEFRRWRRLHNNKHNISVPMKNIDELSKKLTEGIEEMKALVEEGRAELEAKFTPTELRVARNSSKFKRAEEAIKEAEIGVDMLLDAWEDICSLTEYMDSGQWQKDFEADERGEIRKDLPRGVLAEDSLYNTLDRFKDVIGQMADILDQVDFPDEEEEQS